MSVLVGMFVKCLIVGCLLTVCRMPVCLFLNSQICFDVRLVSRILFIVSFRSMFLNFILVEFC